MSLHLKRVYEVPSARDGLRVLVDRMWPRGLSKADARLDLWLKDAAPSTELRKWFAHDPGRWAEFKRRFFAELDARPDVAHALRARTRRRRVTLLYGARDTEHNNAVALAEYLQAGRGSEH